MPNISNAPTTSVAPAQSTLPDTYASFLHNTTLFTFASPSGTTDNVVSGVPQFIGRARLIVTLAAGNATWTGLSPGVDGQQLILWNNDPTNNLTLTTSHAGSTSPFKGSSMGYALFPGFSISLEYMAGNVNAWVVR